MNAHVIPFRLLIANDSQQEAQRLISMLQNAGKACRAQHIDNESALEKVLEEPGWDLAIVQSNSESLPPSDMIRSIRKHNHDLPVVILADEESGNRAIVDGMKLGAKDVVLLDDDQHLLLVIDRELENRQQRKNTRQAERKLREVERRNRELLDSSKDGIAYIQDGMFIYANESFAEMCGYESKDDIEYQPIMDMVRDEDHDTVKNAIRSLPLHEEQSGDNSLSFHIRSSDGNFTPLEAQTQTSQFDEESCIQLIINAGYVSNELLEAELATAKNTDSVTGLANKSKFVDRLSRLIANAAEQETAHSLLYIEIDQFKEKVESVVGIDGAETVLSDMAKLLEPLSQGADMVARVGDSTFAMLSEETSFEKLIFTGDAICDKVRESFFEAKKKTLQLTCSVGIAIANETSLDAQAVIGEAVQAITSLRSRNDGIVGDGSNIYQPEEDSEAVLGSDLQYALSHNRFRLLFQPVVSLRGDETERYEALLRMLDQDDKEVSPTKFLQTAESMQIVPKIDRWVILEAIKHLSKHCDMKRHTQLLVNISAHSLSDESLIPWLSVAFKAAKVDPGMVVFEVSELDVTQYLTSAKKFIEEASSMGIRFCITHFGCSLEPMSLLEHIDVEQIKIDGTFSLDIQENPQNIETLQSMLEELKAQGKTIIVPMIENASILSTLWKMGVHCIQGNYLQPPGMAMDYEFGVESAS